MLASESPATLTRIEYDFNGLLHELTGDPIMYRYILMVLFATATAVWAQDQSADEEAATESAAKTVEEMTEAELDDLDLDDNQDYTEEDEDVFIPSDVVSYQQSVPFPVDI